MNWTMYWLLMLAVALLNGVLTAINGGQLAVVGRGHGGLRGGGRRGRLGRQPAA